MRRFSSSDVQSVFKAYPPALRARLMALRELVFDTAAGRRAWAGSPKP